MPNWNQILTEIAAAGNSHDQVRKKYMNLLHLHTGRNVIAYYSGWLQKVQPTRPGGPIIPFGIVDGDKTGFMACIHMLDRSKGLDLILHTPGGETAATESLVDYLRSMFRTDLRIIVPQLAMSAGTMIACSGKEILMGKHSSLGPIDPLLGGVSVEAVIEEFNRARTEIIQKPALIPYWQALLAKYPPAFVGDCMKAKDWSHQITTEWLMSGMFEGDPGASEKAKKIVRFLSDHSKSKSHSRHFSATQAVNEGLKVSQIESDDALQEAVLSVHHAFTITLTHTRAFKIIENHLGTAYVLLINQ